MNSAGQLIESRLQNLETHLEQENPVLLNTVQSFRTLDRVAYRMGLLEPDDSFATKIPWWPLIAVLGTFSSGKSTFINHYLGFRTQRTGNQAVDDKFTVLCYSHEETPHALPGVALDSDPRFPFYRMSDEIEKVAKGEGRRIDAYLQLKTCPSENLRGKILLGPVVDRLGGRRGFLTAMALVAAFGAMGAMAPTLLLLTVFYSANRLAGSAGWGAMVKMTPAWWPRHI